MCSKPLHLEIQLYQHNNRQLEIEAFKTPFRTPLDTENRWVKLAKLVPWDFVEEVYLRSLGRKKEGQRALPGRFAFGSILIQEKLGLTDRETVDTIRENPYLQWFLGLQEFQIKPPLDQSQLCRFRKRFPAQAIAEINERILLAARKSDRDDLPFSRSGVSTVCLHRATPFLHSTMDTMSSISCTSLSVALSQVLRFLCSYMSSS
ncbi:hypothetical protein CSA37_04840 [Candidatus Fermentibacteria bacterium]|nr:MAG: hypothetical protein CSA37_04840 [Candidatus Fermentibacteria bacterium]